MLTAGDPVDIGRLVQSFHGQDKAGSVCWVVQHVKNGDGGQDQDSAKPSLQCPQFSMPDREERAGKPRLQAGGRSQVESISFAAGYMAVGGLSRGGARTLLLAGFRGSMAIGRSLHIYQRSSLGLVVNPNAVSVKCCIRYLPEILAK